MNCVNDEVGELKPKGQRPPCAGCGRFDALAYYTAGPNGWGPLPPGKWQTCGDCATIAIAGHPQTSGYCNDNSNCDFCRSFRAARPFPAQPGQK